VAGVYSRRAAKSFGFNCCNSILGPKRMKAKKGVGSGNQNVTSERNLPKPHIVTETKKHQKRHPRWEKRKADLQAIQ